MLPLPIPILSASAPASQSIFACAIVTTILDFSYLNKKLEHGRIGSNVDFLFSTSSTSNLRSFKFKSRYPIVVLIPHPLVKGVILGILLFWVYYS